VRSLVAVARTGVGVVGSVNREMGMLADCLHEDQNLASIDLAKALQTLMIFVVLNHSKAGTGNGGFSKS
jgi:hypothetical protein